MTTASTEAATPTKPKRFRRWAKRPTDPNHEANTFLSVRDVQLVIRELESLEKRLTNIGGRDAAYQRRHARRLIDKLYAVKWT